MGHDMNSDKSSVTSRDIEFTADGHALRGWLRLPVGTAPHSLVILGHGLGGLKEWTIPDVADALVQDGSAAMAFDYRNWGDSAIVTLQSGHVPGWWAGTHGAHSVFGVRRGPGRLWRAT